jgi:hypothetical protein
VLKAHKSGAAIEYERAMLLSPVAVSKIYRCLDQLWDGALASQDGPGNEKLLQMPLFQLKAYTDLAPTLSLEKNHVVREKLNRQEMARDRAFGEWYRWMEVAVEAVGRAGVAKAPLWQTRATRFRIGGQLLLQTLTSILTTGTRATMTMMNFMKIPMTTSTTTRIVVPRINIKDRERLQWMMTPKQ